MLKQRFAPRRSLRVALVLCALAPCVSPLGAAAQTPDDYNTDRERAFQLTNESRFTEALPLLEKLAGLNAKDAEVAFMLGFATLTSAKTLKTAEARQQARARAHKAFTHAKELGFKHPLLHSILESLPPDGGGEALYSKNREADEAMREGESAFVQGNLDGALAAYQRALQLDPALYEAALFAGDMLYKKGSGEKATEWYARAIAIDANRETAYRYWASSLMAQGKQAEARDKLIEAIIAEPYTRLSWAGLSRWAQENGVQLSHPRIEPPAPSKDDKTTTATDKLKEQDGSTAWMAYAATRAAWQAEKFAREFPNEKTYRHTLREEADALQQVAAAVRRQQKEGKIKQLDPMLDNLLRLSDAGLVEAYVLLARPDDGIIRDYEAYRKTERNKLRRYLSEYVAPKTGTLTGMKTSD
jgi:tetratricopeptide (TPR) repeat protein